MNISDTEISKVYPPDYALVSDARVAVAPLAEALKVRVGEVKTARVDGQDWPARSVDRPDGAAVHYQIPVIWIIFDDEKFKLIKLYQLEACHETRLVEFRNPDFAAYARACGADGYRADTLEQFEDVFRAALGSARPSVIDAQVTRWAVPHYSPSPAGIVAEVIEARFRPG